MENLVKAIFTCALLSTVSCQYFNSPDKRSAATVSTETVSYSDQFPDQPDSSINISNAYNGMFLDTSFIEQYGKKNQLTSDNSGAIRRFYNLRNFQYCWFAKDGLTEQGRAFWNAYTYAKTHGQKEAVTDKFLVARMDTILNLDTLQITSEDTSYRQTEVALTDRFIRYYNQSDKQSFLYRIPLTQLLPARKADPVAMADSVLNFKPTEGGVDSLKDPFSLMISQLALYDSVAKKGGWQPVPSLIKKLKKGIASSAVTGIKKRLHATNEFNSQDTTSKFTDSLEAAIKLYQQHNGLNEDGVVTDSLITTMNVTVQQRLQQILVNLNRLAWLPPQIKDNFVAVNIPDFMLEVYQGDSVPVEMEVVVGKEGTNTMMFTGDLNEVVFNPTWHLPASIVKKEILPKLESDPDYLKSRNMVIVRHNDSLPEINQLPGPANALGKVKFLFPNSYDIYLHDTESKELFKNSVRAFSHGCIRLEDAETMSDYVLRNNTGWNPEKIRKAMNNNKEQKVAVKTPIPVMITYFTVWVDRNGEINFRDDIYQHDKRTENMMFNNS